MQCKTYSREFNPGASLHVLFQDEHIPPLLPVCDHYAGSEKLMRKSLALQQQLGPVFDLTFDCEDGAAAGNERAHAQLVAQLVCDPANQFGRVGVRLHDLRSPFFALDLEKIVARCAPRLAYVMLPKCGNLAEVEEASAVVTRAAQAAGRDDLPIHVLIESPAALEDVAAIAALPQVQSLSFGIMDFVSAHRGAIPAQAMRSPQQFSHPLVVRAKLEIAAACHAHGKIPAHNVTTEIKDSTIVADDARRAALELGYLRMWSIHPQQIGPIVAAFTPCVAEIKEAASILAAAQAANWGPIKQDDRLHDRASYRYYWTLLQRARACGLTLPETVQKML